MNMGWFHFPEIEREEWREHTDFLFGIIIWLFALFGFCVGLHWLLRVGLAVWRMWFA
jgi:hypothetical protein